MVKKYCKGIPLYVAAIVVVLYLNALAESWDAAAGATLPATHQLHRHP